MKRAWSRKAAFIKGVVQDFFMNSPPSNDFRTTPLDCRCGTLLTHIRIHMGLKVVRFTRAIVSV